MQRMLVDAGNGTTLVGVPATVLDRAVLADRALSVYGVMCDRLMDIVEPERIVEIRTAAAGLKSMLHAIQVEELRKGARATQLPSKAVIRYRSVDYEVDLDACWAALRSAYQREVQAGQAHPLDAMVARAGITSTVMNRFLRGASVADVEIDAVVALLFADKVPNNVLRQVKADNQPPRGN
jgi:hypothetical protein